MIIYVIRCTNLHENGNSDKEILLGRLLIYCQNLALVITNPLECQHKINNLYNHTGINMLKTKFIHA